MPAGTARNSGAGEDVTRRAARAPAALTLHGHPRQTAPRQRPRRPLRRRDLHRLRRLPADRARDLRGGLRPLLRSRAAGLGGGPTARAHGARGLPDGVDRDAHRGRTSGRAWRGSPSRSKTGSPSADSPRNAPSAPGATSIERPAGNVLVDSPKAVPRLLAEFERRGGAFHDVPDAPGRRRRPRGLPPAIRLRTGPASRRCHAPTRAASNGSSRVATRSPSLRTSSRFRLPATRRGHAVLLYREKFLFTGDHLAWSRRRGSLVAFRDACWYSWTEQIRSMESLLDIPFEWVLPGHGGWKRFATALEAREALARCLDWMRTV